MKFPQLSPFRSTAHLCQAVSFCMLLGTLACPAAEDPVPGSPAASEEANAGNHRAKAESGDALAQAMLADSLYHGIPSDAAFEEAAMWAEKSAAQGCPIGTAILAEMYQTGNGRPYDPEKAEQLAGSSREPLLSGVETGNPVWLRWAALSPARESKEMHFIGSMEGNVSHFARNLPFMRKAMESGDPMAPVEWARRFHRWSPGAEEAADRASVMQHLKKAAENGYPAALHEMGECYALGIEFPADPAQAAEWYEKAAAAGWTPSRIALAELAGKNELGAKLVARVAELQRGSESPKNSAVAESWFRGFATGTPFPKDPALAEEWLGRLEKDRAALAIARIIAPLLKRGSGQEANRWFERMKALDPGPVAYGIISRAAYDADAREKAIWYERAAEGGNVDAMTDLAEQFGSGYLRPKDDSEARDWHQKAIASGQNRALWTYARYLIKQEDFADARDLLKQAADTGYLYACEDLAKLLMTGRGGPKDDAGAARHYRKLAEAGWFVPAAHLVNLLEKKRAKPVDAKEVSRLQASIDACLKGMSDANRRMATREIANDLSNAGDEKGAMRWWMLAAEAGDSGAAGIVASADPALLKDVKSPTMIDSLKASAKEGDVEAMYDLATAYEKGNGVKADPVEAFRWYEAAARKNHYLALESLGVMCIGGRGVPKNPKKGVEWVKKAAEKGSTSNIAVLASLYSSGKHVPQNGAEAARLYEQAGLAGHSAAMADLGLLYAQGRGVPKEYVTAYMWANAAAATASDPDLRKHSEKLRMLIEEKMTPPQMALAQQQTLSLLDRVKKERDKAAAKSSEAESGGDAPGAPPAAAPQVKTATGTGWAVTADGHLLTAAHVVRNATSIHAIDGQGHSSFAIVLKMDEANDLALLKIVGATRPVPLRTKVVMGQKVATIGFPNTSLQGSEAKVTEGIVNSLSGVTDDPRQMQISVPVQPGNSGGPLLDMTGAAVGLVSSRLSDQITLRQSGALPQMVNYAQKISYAGVMLEGLTLPSAPAEASAMDLPALVESVRPSVYFLRCKVEPK